MSSLSCFCNMRADATMSAWYPGTECEHELRGSACSIGMGAIEPGVNCRELLVGGAGGPGHAA